MESGSSRAGSKGQAEGKENRRGPREQTREGKPQRLEAAFFNWMDFKD